MNEKIELPPPIDFKQIKNKKKVNFFNPFDVINSNNISLPRIIKNEKNEKNEKDEEINK
jgi:hypothetical protein